MQNITELELKVIEAIDKSEYGDALEDGVWSEYIAEDAGIAKRSFPGVASSLVQKGLVKIYDHDPGKGVIQLTDEGIKVAIALHQEGRIKKLNKKGYNKDY